MQLGQGRGFKRTWKRHEGSQIEWGNLEESCVKFDVEDGSDIEGSYCGMDQDKATELRDDHHHGSRVQALASVT